MADFEVNRRLKKLIGEVYKTSTLAFSSKYNDNRGVKTSQVLRERNGLSSKLLDLIIQAYPEINKSWLLTGEGEMFKLPKNSLGQLTSEEIIDAVEVAMTHQFRSGEIFSADAVSRMMAEKDAKIEELQKRIWTLEQENENLKSK